jgi:NAD kinase
MQSRFYCVNEIIVTTKQSLVLTQIRVFLRASEMRRSGSDGVFQI